MYWWVYLLVCAVVGVALGLRSVLRHGQTHPSTEEGDQ